MASKQAGSVSISISMDLTHAIFLQELMDEEGLTRSQTICRVIQLAKAYRALMREKQVPEHEKFVEIPPKKHKK